VSDTQTSVLKRSENLIVQLSNETGASGVKATESARAIYSSGLSLTQGANALAPIIPIDRLYEAPRDIPSRIIPALELLTEADRLLEGARKAKSRLDADLATQRVQALLPRLFEYRGIGDGFGVIINSVYFSLENLQGTPLTSDQLNVVWRTLRELRAQPAMTLEQGIHRAEELESCGLVVDPSDVAFLFGESETSENG
jgi:hypothetical protein